MWTILFFGQNVDLNQFSFWIRKSPSENKTQMERVVYFIDGNDNSKLYASFKENIVLFVRVPAIYSCLL